MHQSDRHNVRRRRRCRCCGSASVVVLAVRHREASKWPYKGLVGFDGAFDGATVTSDQTKEPGRVASAPRLNLDDRRRLLDAIRAVEAMVERHVRDSVVEELSHELGPAFRP